jgi:hypothetical protein
VATGSSCRPAGTRTEDAEAEGVVGSIEEVAPGLVEGEDPDPMAVLRVVGSDLGRTGAETATTSDRGDARVVSRFTPSIGPSRYRY